MVSMGLQAESYWRSRLVQDRDRLAERRRLGLAQAHSAAERLRSRWPGLTGVWLFGSVLGPGFREHSDLDLLAEGLPPEALIEAIGIAEAAGPLPVDLKRAEDLEMPLRQRLLRQSRQLLPAGAQGEGDAG
jgi:predicted nucleotidyltransferase